MSYGENPHQRGAYYAERGARTHLLARVEQLHGKALSFNNLYDLDAARGLAGRVRAAGLRDREAQQPLRRRGRRRSSARPTSAARDCDPVSAYGGVIVVNRPVDGRSASCSPAPSSRCCWRPATTTAALAALTRKPNTRIMLNAERRRTNPGERDLRRVCGGLLVQDRDAEARTATR